MFKDEQFKFEDIFKVDLETQDSIKLASAKIDEAAKAARKCLTMPEFHFYRIQFERAQEAIIDKMIQYTSAFFASEHGDMNKYGANMARFMTKLQDLRVLLNTVEKEAKRGTKE